MKRVSFLATAFLSASLVQGVAAQSVGAPVSTDASTQATQDKKDAKTKAKPPIKATTGKKTTTSQDAAYALAARKGTAESTKPTPPK